MCGGGGGLTQWQHVCNTAYSRHVTVTVFHEPFTSSTRAVLGHVRCFEADMREVSGYFRQADRQAGWVQHPPCLELVMALGASVGGAALLLAAAAATSATETLCWLPKRAKFPLCNFQLMKQDQQHLPDY